MREFLLTWSTELVRRDSPDEMAQFLTADDPINKSVEALEAANNLVTPIVNYIREVKGIESMMMGRADSSEKVKAGTTTTTVEEEDGYPASRTVKEESVS